MFQASKCVAVKNTLKLKPITFDVLDKFNTERSVFIYHPTTLPRSINSFLKKLDHQFSLKLKFNLKGFRLVLGSVDALKKIKLISIHYKTPPEGVKCKTLILPVKNILVSRS